MTILPKKKAKEKQGSQQQQQHDSSSESDHEGPHSVPVAAGGCSPPPEVEEGEEEEEEVEEQSTSYHHHYHTPPDYYQRCVSEREGEGGRSERKRGERKEGREQVRQRHTSVFLQTLHKQWGVLTRATCTKQVSWVPPTRSSSQTKGPSTPCFSLKQRSCLLCRLQQCRGIRRRRGRIL